MNIKKYVLWICFLCVFGFYNKCYGYVISFPTQPYSIVSSDFNHDGFEDIAVGFNGAIVMFWGKENGQFSTTNVYYVIFNGRADKMIAADINSDGWTDIIVSDGIKSHLKIVLNRGASFSIHDEYSSFATSAMAVGFINSDPYLDIVVASPSGGFGVFYSKGNFDLKSNTWFDYTFYPLFSDKCRSFSLSDIDGNGVLDIVALGNNRIYVLQNTGGDFNVSSSMQTGGDPSAVSCADFNHDNIPDIVVANKMSNNIGVYFGKSEGTYNNIPVFYDVGTRPISIKIGDFNYDGYLDIAVLCESENSIRFLLDTGFGNFSISSTVLSTNLMPQDILVGDFNFNGRADIVSFSGRENKMSIFLDSEITNNQSLNLPSIDVQVSKDGQSPSDTPITLNLGQDKNLQIYIQVKANDFHGYLANLYLEIGAVSMASSEESSTTASVSYYSITNSGISSGESPFMSNWNIVNLPLNMVYNIDLYDLFLTLGKPSFLTIRAKLAFSENSPIPYSSYYVSDTINVVLSSSSISSLPNLTLEAYKSGDYVQTYVSLSAGSALGLPADIYLWLECKQNTTYQDPTTGQWTMSYCDWIKAYPFEPWDHPANVSCNEQTIDPFSPPSSQNSINYPEINDISPFVKGWIVSDIPRVFLFNVPVSALPQGYKCQVKAGLKILNWDGMAYTIFSQSGEF